MMHIPEKLKGTLAIDYKSILQNEGTDVLSMLGDAAISSAVDSIPILGVLNALKKLPGNIQAQNFARSMVEFLDGVKEITPEDREEALNKIEKAGEDYSGNIIITILDKQDNINKSRILAKLFKALVREEIDGEDFLRLSSVLNRMSYVDIKNLANYKEEYYRAGETESLLATGTISISTINGGTADEGEKESENENKYKLSPLGCMLLKFGLETDVEIEAYKASTKVAGIPVWEPIEDAEIDKLFKENIK